MPPVTGSDPQMKKRFTDARAMAGGYSYKRVQAGGAAKFRDVPDKNGFSHVAESLQYLLVGGGEARLLVKRPHSGPRAELAVMG